MQYNVYNVQQSMILSSYNMIPWVSIFVFFGESAETSQWHGENREEIKLFGRAKLSSYGQVSKVKECCWQKINKNELKILKYGGAAFGISSAECSHGTRYNCVFTLTIMLLLCQRSGFYSTQWIL